MIDIRVVREHPELVVEAIKKKFKHDKLKILEEVQAKDSEWRTLKGKLDALRAERNTLSKQIGDLKKAGKDTKAVMKKASSIPDEIAKIEVHASKLETQVSELLDQLPNLMHSSVPIGKSDKDNVVLKVIGKPKTPKFEVQSHADVAEKLGCAD
jgi:seryl-tRNA synthetase